MTPEMSLKVQEWRRRSREGTLTQDELKEAIAALREDRIGAAETSSKSRSRKAAAKVEVNSEDLLSELGDL